MLRQHHNHMTHQLWKYNKKHKMKYNNKQNKKH